MAEMENSAAGSLLHPKIAKFYQTNENLSDNGQYSRYINEDCTYNWPLLERLLLDDGESPNEHPEFPKIYAEYIQYFKLLEPVLHQSEAALSQSIVDRKDLLSFSIWFTKLHWLGHQTQMHTILQEHLHPFSETSTVENILFLTAALENGLANVYYTITKKTPPHLLRDLLDTKELRDVFGICPILFLKIIMGSPNAVNLRNIVWHGFPLPAEVPPFYTATLLIAAASLAVLIEKKRLALESRGQIKILNPDVCKIKDVSINVLLLHDLPRMREAIKSSKWIGQSEHKAFWQQIVQHYENDSHWQMVILILPQIELLLRRIYGKTNSFDISAKLEEYYITMDTIFELKDNRLLNGHLGTGTLHFFYDIFIAPYGLRIRDKVSHGEVDLNSINGNLCMVLLYAALNLISSNEGYPLDYYRSRYHLNTLALGCIESSRYAVLQLMKLKSPDGYELEFNWDQQSIAALQELEVPRSEEIFDRHKKEPEIMTMILRIAQHVRGVCTNYELSFEERFDMLLKRELRSRARKTLQRMVASMTEIGVTLENVVHNLTRLSNLMLSNDNDWFEEKFEDIQRFCKQTLKITENLLQFSDKGSNEWVNAVACCDMFRKTSTDFLKTVR